MAVCMRLPCKTSQTTSCSMQHHIYRLNNQSESLLNTCILNWITNEELSPKGRSPSGGRIMNPSSSDTQRIITTVFWIPGSSPTTLCTRLRPRMTEWGVAIARNELSIFHFQLRTSPSSSTNLTHPHALLITMILSRARAGNAYFKNRASGHAIFDN